MAATGPSTVSLPEAAADGALSPDARPIDPGASVPEASKSGEAKPAAPPRIRLNPDEQVSEAAQRSLRLGLEALSAYLPDVLKGEIEPLHQMRVTTRRIRVLVEIFARVIHGRRVKIYRRDLRWLGQSAGGLRECDVTEALLRSRSSRIDPAVADALAPIYETLSSRRRLEHEKIVAMLTGPRYRILVERLAKTPVRKLPPTTTVALMAPEMVRGLSRDVSRAVAKIAPDVDPATLHHLRVRIKRLRYAFEMLDELGGKRSRRAARRLGRMQTTLGDFNDVTIAIAWLRHYGEESAAPPAALLATGAFIQSLGMRQRKLAARSLKEWKRLDRSGIIREAVAEIARNSNERRHEEARSDDAA
jgi:CHAD domain-containing protein